MAKRAGDIVINIRAGTGNVQSDLNKASNAFKQFGHSSVTGVQATSASLRLLEGNVTNNLRAVENFLAKTLGLGNALKAAFPVVGALAFAGVLGELGTKVVNFFREVQQGPEKARGAFADLNSSARLTNAALTVTNEHLKTDIAKLEGKPVNNLAIALAEAREAADKLDSSLQRTLSDAYKLVNEQSGNWFERVGKGIAGEADTKDIAEELGGETGYGGFRERTRGLGGSKLAAEYQAEIARFQQQIQNADDAAQQYGSAGFDGSPVVGNMKRRLELLRGAVQLLQKEAEQIDLTAANVGLSQRKSGLQDVAEAAGLGKPFQDKLKALDAELAAVRGKLSAVGLSQSSQILATGYAKAVEVIAEVNKALEKNHQALTVSEADAIRSREIQIALAQAEDQWRTHFEQATDTLNDRIAAQERLNQAIGGSYAQRRAAAVESQVAQTVGAGNYNDPEFMQKHVQQVAALRERIGRDEDLKESGRNKNALQALDDKIRLTNALADAERQGGEAVRQAELAERIRVETRGLDADAAAALTQKLIEEDAAERRKDTQTQLTALKNEAAAAERTAEAYGHKARVQAEAQNAYDKAIQGGKSPDVAQAEANAVILKDQNEIAAKASQLATSYADQLETITRTESALRNIAAIQGNSVAIQAALRDLEQERLQLEINMDLHQDSAKAGLQAFFLEMQQQAETLSQIIYTALNSALDKTSENLANMLTGQKPKGQTWGQAWGKEFQDIGHQLTQSTVRSGLQRGLGALGQKFGFSIPGLGKRGDSPQNPLYVSPVGGIGGGGNAVPNPLGGILNGKVFSGSEGGGIFSFASKLLESYPGLADGGDVYPGGAYLVGENAPELFTPRSAGTVSPLHKMGSTTHQHNYNIDARGAEIGVESRIGAAIEEAHNSAIKNSVRVQAERARRTPQKTKQR